MERFSFGANWQWTICIQWANKSIFHSPQNIESIEIMKTPRTVTISPPDCHELARVRSHNSGQRWASRRSCNEWWHKNSCQSHACVPSVPIHTGLVTYTSCYKRTISGYCKSMQIFWINKKKMTTTTTNHLNNTITVHKLAGDSVKHFSRGKRYKNQQIFSLSLGASWKNDLMYKSQILETHDNCKNWSNKDFSRESNGSFEIFIRLSVI